MNEALLNSIIALHNDKKKDLAMYLGLPANTVSRKLSKRYSMTFTLEEAAKIKKRYEMSLNQFDEVFLKLDE